MLGKHADAQEYRAAAANLAQAVNKAFYDASTGAYVDHLQTHLLMPLATGVVGASGSVSEDSVLASLETAIAKTGGHLDTGLTGNYFMTKFFHRDGAQRFDAWNHEQDDVSELWVLSEAGVHYVARDLGCRRVLWTGRIV